MIGNIYTVTATIYDGSTEIGTVSDALEIKLNPTLVPQGLM
ncbi:MAG: hypothetical protein WBI55_05035 [Eubacteriales bacterium]|jgi:hypothetical protein